MTEATLDIKLWGNSLGLRLPASVARAAGLTVDQRVHITAEEGRIIITLQGPKPLSLADRLASFDPTVHGGETMAAVPLGRETW